ncbi:MAG TPA: hypothetical protein VIL20_16965 [Sandaracinaceae bacterium]
MRPRHLLALPLLLPLLLTTAGCDLPLPTRLFGFTFESPAHGLLSLAGDAPIAVRLPLPPFGRIESLEVRVNGAPALDLAGGGLAIEGRSAVGTLPGLPEGRHELEAAMVLRVAAFRLVLAVRSSVERIALDRPDRCEILNDVECLLPFPSSRYLVPASTATGVRVAYPEGVLPGLPAPLDSAAFGGQDGFSPGVQVLMHFPGGVDPERSGASRLLPDTRTHDETSLRPDSPTLLLDATEGMTPVLHWIERDVRAAAGPNPDRELLFLRPAETLKGGHRYVVAMRNLVHPDGTPVEAEPVFAALRDGRPSDIPAVEQRRPAMEALFAELEAAGVPREDLVLAFDFVVQSDEDLTRAMLSMRDQAFAWLAEQSEPTFTVFPLAPPGTTGDVSIEHDCSAPGARTWRQIRGRFQVPLFLSSDPILQATALGRLVDTDGDGRPEPQGVMEAPFVITIPCAALEPETPPLRPILTGHGLFGNGGTVVNVPQNFGATELAYGGPDFLRIAGATDWLGLSSHDFSASNPVNSFIANMLFNANQFGALPDRLRQGMTNALVLARMMREGRFNAHPAFQTPDGRGVFAEPADTLDYFGISLGGIMGTFFAALSPDVGNVALDVPAANFSILLQRSTAISLIDFALGLLNPDPMSQALFFQLGLELWDSAEPVGYLRHVTRDPLPGSGAPKALLYTVAEFDGVVSNEASEIAIRTLGLPNLVDTQSDEGSSVAGRPGIPDVAPPLDPGAPDFIGGSVWYDAGMYGDLSDPALAAFAPPLANRSVQSRCDPHGRTLAIPAEVRQITTFLDDGGIHNFCDGLCDGRATGGGFEPFELPNGAAEPCSPL